MSAFGLPKSERLAGKKHIEELFNKGSYFYLYPFRVYFKPAVDTKNQVLLSVSKRNFKKAVDRNLVKRRMRESFRLNKSKLPEGQTFQIVYIYTAKEILSFSEIQDKMIHSFKRLRYDQEKN